jgi:hypothetical protein
MYRIVMLLACLVFFLFHGFLHPVGVDKPVNI